MRHEKNYVADDLKFCNSNNYNYTYHCLDRHSYGTDVQLDRVARRRQTSMMQKRIIGHSEYYERNFIFYTQTFENTKRHVVFVIMWTRVCACL